MNKKRVAVCISGSGSNLKALIDAAAQPDAAYEIVQVISNRADAGGLAHTANANIPALVLSHKDYPTRDAYDAALHQAFVDAGAELVCLAGFMRILTEDLCRKWEGRMLNIHPSLLPAYKGLHTHARALADGMKEAGCTVHFVSPELDAGPIILQARVPVLPDDTPETLATRVLKEEHRIYAEALNLVARGGVKLEGGRCVSGHEI